MNQIELFLWYHISSFEIINVVVREAKSEGRVPDPNTFLWIAASVAAAAVNYNGIKTLLANGLGTLFIKGNPVLSNGPKSISKNPPDCTILLAEEPFVKVLRNIEICILVNNNVCGKLFSLLESPTTFDENLNVTSVPFFIPDFNLLSCELCLKCYIESFYIDIILK